MRDDFEGNVSPSTGRVYSNRFDVDEPDIVENPHDTARKSVYDMPAAAFEVLNYWIKWALVPEACRVGHSYADPNTGGSFTDDLLDLARTDTTLELTRDEFKGALLISGRTFYPTFRTAHLANWRVPASYVGIVDGSPQWAEFSNLIAELP